VPFGEPGLVVEDLAPAGLDPAGLDPAMIAVDRLRHIVEHGIGIVEQQLDVLEERLLVALDGEHIVAAALKKRFPPRGSSHPVSRAPEARARR
jgi:hypothetical protein